MGNIAKTSSKYHPGNTAPSFWFFLGIATLCGYLRGAPKMGYPKIPWCPFLNGTPPCLDKALKNRTCLHLFPCWCWCCCCCCCCCCLNPHFLFVNRRKKWAAAVVMEDPSLLDGAHVNRGDKFLCRSSAFRDHRDLCSGKPFKWQGAAR